MNTCIRYLLLALLLTETLSGIAQKKGGKELSLALTNHQSAYPFSKGISLLNPKNAHPGVEAGYRWNWRSRPKHDWYQSLKAGYFHHRFIQHAIPVYTELGYRYKLKKHFQFSAALGGGYLHSISAAQVFKLDDKGDYKSAGGIGRSQVLLQLALGTAYQFRLSGRSANIFLQYQQQIQTPFIKSYVPLLPYNAIALGIGWSLKK